MDGFRRRKLWLKIVFSPDLPTNARSPNDIFFELVGGRPRVVVVEVEQSVWQRCGAVSTRAFACLLVRLCWEGAREKVRGVGVRRVGGVGLRIAVQSSAIKNEVEPVMRQIFKIYENTRKYRLREIRSKIHLSAPRKMYYQQERSEKYPAFEQCTLHTRMMPFMNDATSSARVFWSRGPEAHIEPRRNKFPAHMHACVEW